MSNNQVRISLDKLNNIGDALREKRSEVSQYTLDEMPGKIREIIGSTTVEPLSVTQNGIYTAETGKAYSPVTVNVQAGGTIGDVVNFTATNAGNIATITWTDPVDTASGTWAATMIVAKYGGIPSSPIDGETVVLEKTRNKYSVNGYRYQFVSGEDCFFRAFIFTTAGDVRAGSFASVKATIDIVSWSSGTDQQIVNLIAAARKGFVDLEQDAGWSVGDERVIHLDTIPAMTYYDEKMQLSGSYESHAAQDAVFVLLHKGGNELVEAYPNGTPKKCLYVVGMKNYMDNSGMMHYTDKEDPDPPHCNPSFWNVCDRHSWLNSFFLNAIPETIRPIFQRSRVYCSMWGGGDHTEDIFFLPSQTEIFGPDSDKKIQWDYYKTADPSKHKNSDDSTFDHWWTRDGYFESIGSRNGAVYYAIKSKWSASSGTLQTIATRGISPVACI